MYIKCDHIKCKLCGTTNVLFFAFKTNVETRKTIYVTSRCKICHLEKQREYNRKYETENKDQRREKNKLYEKNNAKYRAAYRRKLRKKQYRNRCYVD